MENEKKEFTRTTEWRKLMEEYDNFFYADDGMYTVSLCDKELEQYNLDFDYIKSLIKKLKDFEQKYGDLSKNEKDEILRFKEVLIKLDTGTNGIKNIYEKMSNMYNFIEEY